MLLKSKGCKTIAALTAAGVLFLSAGTGLLPLSTVTFVSYAGGFETYAYHTLSRYTGDEENVVIPSTYYQTIGRNAFKNCTTVKSVTIPNTITSIGNYAFEGCTSLENVTIPDSVTSIGTYAFWKCKSLSDVTIPRSVTFINDGLFSECTGLTNITIPDSVTSIGYSSFLGCSGLKTVSIPDSVTSIESSAFYGCSGLSSVSIPASVSLIGDYAFFACTDVTGFNVAAGNTSYASQNGVLYDKNRTILIHYPCKKEGTYSIPKSVKTIKESSFYMCKLLSGVTIPNSVTSIESNAFVLCTGLTTVTIPDSVSTIGNQSFFGCSNLTSITIPDSVKSIGNGAFEGCDNLTDVYYSGTQQQWRELQKDIDGEKTDICLNSNATIHYNCPKISLSITKAPVNVSAYVGSKATFSLEATGNGLTYQWYYKKAGETTWTKWNNKTSASVTTEVYASWNKAQFYCAVTNVGGAKVNSKAVTLTVLPKITAQPANGKAPVNDKVTFTVKATGYNLTYQWYYKKNGEDSWTKWNNKTSASITAEVYASWNKAQVYCRIKDGNGTAISSNTVQMLVAPKITSQPANVSKALNEKATFTVKATGDGLTYQWYYKKPSDTSWVKWSNQTKASATMTVYGSWHNTKVYCAVKNNLGNTVNSQTAVLSVVPKITFQPANCVGYVGDKVSFDVEASGTGLTYQWYYKKAGESSWSKWNKKTAATAETEVYASWNGASFYCQVKSSNGASVNSKTATLTVKPKITVQPTNVSGKSGSKISVTVKATGDGLKYQWQYSNDKGKTWSKSSITSSSYTVTLSGGMNGRYVRCIVSDRNNYQVTSKSAVIKVA